MVLRSGKRMVWGSLFPLHRLLVRSRPEVAWRLAQLAERRHWRLALSGPGRTLVGETRRALRDRYFCVYRELFGQRFEEVEGVVLEVGCGPARTISKMRGRLRIGVDPLLPFPHLANLRDELNSDGVVYVAAVGEALPVRTGAVDATLCVNVLDHVLNPELVVAEIARVLRPRGWLFLNCDVDQPRRTTIEYVLHPSRLSSDRVADMLRPCFEIEACSVQYGPRNPRVRSVAIAARRRQRSEGRPSFTGAGGTVACV